MRAESGLEAEKLKSRKELRALGQNPNPSNPEGFGTPAGFNCTLVNTGAARKGWPPALFRNLSIHPFGPTFRQSCTIRLGQPSGRIHQCRAGADEHRSGPDHRQMDLCFGTAMPHRTEQRGIDSGEACQRPSIQPIIFPAALANQSHIARMRHDHFVPQLGQLPADPR